MTTQSRLIIFFNFPKSSPFPGFDVFLNRLVWTTLTTPKRHKDHPSSRIPPPIRLRKDLVGQGLRNPQLWQKFSQHLQPTPLLAAPLEPQALPPRPAAHGQAQARPALPPAAVPPREWPLARTARPREQALA